MNKTKELEIIEKIEVIINRHSPMENFEVKELCAKDIYNEVVIQYANWKIKELQKEYNKLDKLCGKYSNVIAMVYDGERVDIAEKRVGLIK